jgi:hypothetical protein
VEELLPPIERTMPIKKLITIELQPVAKPDKYHPETAQYLESNQGILAFYRHAREGGHPGQAFLWTPACAGVTDPRKFMTAVQAVLFACDASHCSLAEIEW